MATAALDRRTPPLARLGVGAKLMLLVLLPVAVLLGFTIAGSVECLAECVVAQRFPKCNRAVVRRQ